jgi:hypothetical protein
MRKEDVLTIECHQLKTGPCSLYTNLFGVETTTVLFPDLVNDLLMALVLPTCGFPVNRYALPISSLSE